MTPEEGRLVEIGFLLLLIVIYLIGKERGRGR